MKFPVFLITETGSGIIAIGATDEAVLPKFVSVSFTILCAYMLKVSEQTDRSKKIFFINVNGFTVKNN